MTPRARRVSPRRHQRPTEVRHGSGFYPYRGIELVRGEGARLWDNNGRAYWDIGASYGCANVGHSHPQVVEAVTRQASRLAHASGAFANDTRSAFVRSLLDAVGGSLDRVFLSNSGTEAVEAALKVALASTGRDGIVALEGGFHGRTLGALSATHNAAYRTPFAGRLAATDFVPADDATAMEEAVTDATAAVVVEPVQGEGGVREVPTDVLRAARERCDETGALLVVDEVQTGIHRTGPFLAIERAGVRPDVVCMAKSLAGGLPLGATIFDASVELPGEGAHGSTFGGNPIACAAATAVLDVCHKEQLGERASGLGRHTLERLDGLRDLEVVRDVRGVGLMLAVELDVRATPVLKRLQNVGLLALPAGVETVRLLPPLVAPEEALDETVDALSTILGTLQ